MAPASRRGGARGGRAGTGRGGSTNPFAHHGSAATRHVRQDRDGDVSMGGAAPRGGGITKSTGRGGRGASSAAGGRGGATRNPFASTNAQRQILQQLGKSGASTNNGRLTAPRSGSQLYDISITGWTNSKAASNEDRGITSLKQFLEKKANTRNKKQALDAGEKSRRLIRISKHRVEGDAFIISVPGDDVAAYLSVDGYQFAGANLSIKELNNRTTSPSQSTDTQENSDGTERLKQAFREFLHRRYIPEGKILDLSNLAADPELQSVGLFTGNAKKTKFIPALMKVLVSELEANNLKKEDIFESISLADNELPDLALVTTVAPTLPHIRNLDLSNNNFASVGALEAWRRKFRSLENLIITGTPLDQSALSELIRWFPKLRFLNGKQVRSDADLAKPTSYGPPVKGPHFVDENGIAEGFLTDFFLGYDLNRTQLLNMYYDNDSEFSLNINTSAHRDPNSKNSTQRQEWDLYIPQSRNLKHLKGMNQRMSRKKQGKDAIGSLWNSLPKTVHPSFADNPSKWCIECQPITGVRDATGQYPDGVNGFSIDVHGEYTDINNNASEPEKLRSFDRKFILGPSAPDAPRQARVVSDILTVRAYGGSHAWQATEAAQQAAVISGPPASEEEMKVQELGKMTNMTVESCMECLITSGWDLSKAMALFDTTKTQLPSTAFNS